MNGKQLVCKQQKCSKKKDRACPLSAETYIRSQTDKPLVTREKNNSQGWVSGPHARLSSPALLSEGVFGNGRGWIRGPMISQKLIFRSLLQREEMLGGDLESSPPVCKQEDGKLLMNFICKWPFDSKMKRIPGTHFTL